MVVVSKEAAETVSLSGGMLEVEGESDFTAEPVAPGKKGVRVNRGRGVSIRNKEVTTAPARPKDKSASYLIMGRLCLGRSFFFQIPGISQR